MISMAHYFSPIVKHIFQFFYFMARFILWCLFTILGRLFSTTFFFQTFYYDRRSVTALPAPTGGVKSTSGIEALSRRTEVRLARRRESAASRRVASPRVAPLQNASATRVTLVSAACALSLCYAGPLLSGLFPLDLQLRILSRLFHPFGIVRCNSDLTFERHFSSHFFLSHICAFVRSPARHLARSLHHSYASTRSSRTNCRNTL